MYSKLQAPLQGQSQVPVRWRTDHVHEIGQRDKETTMRSTAANIGPSSMRQPDQESSGAHLSVDPEV